MTEPEIVVDVVHGGTARYKTESCEIALGFGSSYRLITDLNHEYMHFVLHQNFGIRVSEMWDNVSALGELDGVYGDNFHERN